MSRVCEEPREMDICLTLILLSSAVRITKTENVRLVDGDSRCAGRVEVFHREQWGSVCDDYWNMRAAAVVCRELGCGEAVDALGEAHFGPGSGPIWMRYLDCSESESTLKNCGLSGLWVDQCNHEEDAGVICSGVRLVGGSHCSGRVEVLHGMTWSTVCGADFEQQDAEVVCRELGCGSLVEVQGAGTFGRDEGLVWEKKLQCRGTESQIHFCPISTLEHNCSHYSDVGLVCADSVRLADAGSKCAGRVEVFHREEWGTVCDDNWNIKAAAVVCRELGCGEAVDALHQSHFGSGSESQSIWMDDVDCKGSESTLKNCKSAEFGVHDCDHDKDAGVICSEVRLVGGSRCSGRVEVLNGMNWIQVCDADFNKQDAEVVCRELGCGPPVEVLGAATFGIGKEQKWTKEFQCKGDESQTHFCPTSTLNHNCSHSNYVGLVCAEAVKLVDGGSQCAGRVEVFYRGKWGTVCDDTWNMKAAAVVCKELGCSEAIDATGNAYFGNGTGPVWMVIGDCSGSESTLKNCLSGEWGEDYCSHDDDAGVVCAGVKLVGGSHCSGRVEVLHGMTWVTVCGADFGQQDAEVVCRELGCGSPVEVLGADAFGRGEGQVWEKKLQCRGTESQIHFCPTSSIKHNCSHSNDVGLVCAAGVRLVDGGSPCAGRVEVLHRGHWSTVCDDNWNMRAAAVVCRELGCGEAVDTHVNAHPGSGPFWMNVYCTGSESTLKNCGSSRWGGHNCHHGRVSAVICSGHRKPRLMDGPHLCSGRVEVLHGKTWATVCDGEFDQQDAEVVCRELGCGLPVEVLKASAFGKGKSQVWAKELQCRGNESQIYFCPGSFTLEHNCSHENDVGLICSGHTDARLVSGLDSCSGRVELKYLNDWGTVCAVSWSMRAAHVLCEQLNCGSSVAVLESDWFGAGNGQIWADMFDCQGNETHLSQCPISSWSRAACSHKQDAGVICNRSSLAFHEGLVRLSGGNECQGEVEVYFMQDWRRVLLHSWGLPEASVVCRQLGCGSVLSYNSSLSKTEHSHMCAVGFSCSGSEAHLGNCRSAKPATCSSGEQLSMTCSGVNQAHSSIRLVGSGGDCAGRLEVFYNGSWGTVRNDLWDIEDAQVVCRQLQCSLALSDHFLSWFGAGTGPIWLNQVECTGKELALWDCRFQISEEDDSGHQNDVGVVCSEFKEVRLTEGCKGNLEVFYNGTWGNVCENAIDKETASLICRELNCGSTGEEYLSKTRLKSAPNWLDDLKCRKHDATLWHCPSSPWRNNKCDYVAHITCTDVEEHHKRQACQKQCSNHLPLRLRGGKGGCSGRLELYYNATWGTICSDQWDIKDAQVVCRQLGCGQAVSADRNAAFGAGEGVIWLNSVNCRGNEIHLWDCLYSLKNHTECFHKQDAGLTCSDISILSSDTFKKTTTTITGQKKKTNTTQTPLADTFSIPTLTVFVLGTLLFMSLVLIVVLIYHNREFRRVLSKSRRKSDYTEAVYEEINLNFNAKRPTSSLQRGGLITEAQHSGYEYIDEALHSGDRATVDSPESYDDVITAGLILEDANDMMEDYDDAVPTGIIQNTIADTLEDYDDAITAGQNVKDAEDYDDVEGLQKD